MTPTEKSPAIDSLITAVTQKDRQSVIRTGRECMTCSDPDLTFRDRLSHKEYTISGMCQKCQDSVFRDPEEEEGDEQNGQQII